MAFAFSQICLWLLWLDALPCSAMFHNKKVGECESTSPSKILRQHAHSLFLNNKLAGQDAEQLQNEIADCGVTGFKRKRTSGENKSNPKAARNMLRKCLKHSQWPQIYVAEIRTFHPKMQIEILQDMAFILPHELLFALGDFNSVDTLTTLDGAATSVKNHCQAAAELLQCPVAAMGLWCDGTPSNWERTKSLELLLINFPGLSGSNKTWRFPVAAVPHEHLSKGSTFEDIFQIMAWSFQQCLLGTMPNTRHDGLQFNSTDSWRKKKAGKLLPCKAILAEVRADWKCQSEIFHLPHWNKNDGLCCKCSATPVSFKDFSSFASWRHERINHWMFLERQLQFTIAHFSPLLVSKSIGCTLWIWGCPAMLLEMPVGICLENSLEIDPTKWQPYF